MRRKQQSAILQTSVSTVPLESHPFLQVLAKDPCRLCSKESNASFSIFSDKGVKKNVTVLVKKYLNFEIFETDITSKTICKKCCDQLTRFHQFASTAKAVQEKLFGQKYSIDKLLSQDKSEENKDALNFLNDGCNLDLGPALPQNYDHDEILKSSEDILQGLPSDLETDYEDETTQIAKITEELSRLDGDMTEEEELEAAELEDEQESSTSEEDEEEEPRTRSKAGIKDQERDLAEFYQLICSQCGIKCLSFSALSFHCKKVHDCQPTVRCHCGKSFNRRSHLIRHRNQHLGVHRYKCGTCEKGFHFKFMLRSHMFTHGPDGEKPYKCELCQRTYITKSGLTNHRTMKHLPRRQRVTCNICNSTFSHPNCLYTHKKTVHADQRSFVCHICGKTMSTLGNLNGHLETHKESCNVQCEVCGKSFKTRMRLVRHMEYHKAVVHECQVCGKQYQTRGSLRSHMLVHSEERPHTCNLCEKSFKRSKQLKLHLYQHTGERPYKCQFCPKTFTNAGNRATHKRRIHSKHIAQLPQQTSPGRSDPILSANPAVPESMFCDDEHQQPEANSHQLSNSDLNSLHQIPQLHSVAAVLQQHTMVMSGMVIQHQNMSHLMHSHHLQTAVPPHDFDNLC